MQTQLSENLKFVMAYLQLDIRQLSEIIDADPVRMWEMETQNDADGKNYISLPGYQDDLLSLSDYLTIQLADLILDKIEGDENKIEILETVKGELTSGIELNRIPFRKSVYDGNIDTEGAESNEDVLKSMLSLIQQLVRIEKVYKKRIANDTIDPLPFFE